MNYVYKYAKQILGSLVQHKRVRRLTGLALFLPHRKSRNRMDSTRQEKIKELLKRELSLIFQQKGRSLFGPELISITEVRISPDLSIARVYLSIFPTENKKTIMEAVDERNAQLRYELGNRVRNQLRIIPELHFYLDDTFDQMDRINELLKK